MFLKQCYIISVPCVSLIHLITSWQLLTGYLLIHCTIQDRLSRSFLFLSSFSCMEEGSCADKIMTGSIEFSYILRRVVCHRNCNFTFLYFLKCGQENLIGQFFFRFFIQEQHEDLTKQIKKIVIYTLINTAIHHIPYYLPSLAVQNRLTLIHA